MYKKSFNTLAVSLSSFIILSPSVNVIFHYKRLHWINLAPQLSKNFCYHKSYFCLAYILVSLTFSQKLNTDISLFSITEFVFFGHIF